jgi:hypothetical protein
MKVMMKLAAMFDTARITKGGIKYNIYPYAVEPPVVDDELAGVEFDDRLYLVRCVAPDHKFHDFWISHEFVEDREGLEFMIEQNIGKSNGETLII